MMAGVSRQFSGLKIFSLFLLLLLSKIDLFAHEETPSSATVVTTHDCLDALRKASLSAEIRRGYEDYVSEPTVRFIRSRPGIHGGSHYLIERRAGNLWVSNHQEFVLDLQGSPLRFQELFDRTTAEFFGFTTESAHRTWIPNVDEFKTALQKVKDVLAKMAEAGEIDPAYIPAVNFYSQPSTSDDWMLTYLQNFADNLSLPISNKVRRGYGGINTLVHDLSYHATSAIITPSRGLRIAAAQTKTVLAAYAAIEKHADSLSSPRLTKKWKGIGKLLLLKQIEALDTGTANLGTNMGYFFASNNEQEWYKAVREFTFSSLLSHQVTWTSYPSSPNLAVGQYQGTELIELLFFLLDYRIRKIPEALKYAGQFVDFKNLGIESVDLYPMPLFIKRAIRTEVWARQIPIFTDEEMKPFLLLRPNNADQNDLRQDEKAICSQVVQMRNAIMGAAHKLVHGVFPPDLIPKTCPLP